MFSSVIRFILIALGVLLLSAIHIGLAFILPFPWSKINIIFVLLVVLLFWWDSGYIIWLAFFSHLLIELYTTTPFGVLLFSGTISFLLAFWFYRYFFTNRSWYAAAALGLLTLLIYRSLYFFGLLFCKIFGLTATLPWQNILLTSIWELIFSVPAIALIFFVCSRFSRRLNTALNQSSLFKI